MTVAHVPKGNATGGMVSPTPRLRRAGARLALGTDSRDAALLDAGHRECPADRLDDVGNLVHTAQGRDVEVVIVDGRIVMEAAAAKALWERAR